MTYEEYQEQCYEEGEEPCVTTDHHHWVYSDDDSEECYCSACGIREY